MECEVVTSLVDSVINQMNEGREVRVDLKEAFGLK